MPKTPKGHKRPADVISNAVHVMKIATGEIEESEITEDGRNRAAVMLGSNLHVLRGAPEPHDADVHAPVYPTDERLQQARRSRTTRRPSVYTSCITTSAACIRRSESRQRWKRAWPLTFVASRKSSACLGSFYANS